MQAGESLRPVEFALLDAVHRGVPRRRLIARQVPALRCQPAGEAILHDVLRTCEEDGLLRDDRDASAGRYELTSAGRVRLQADRSVRTATTRVLLRSHQPAR